MPSLVVMLNEVKNLGFFLLAFDDAPQGNIWMFSRVR
jgi:hypothetical protein